MTGTNRLYFLLFTADGADGICRSVITLANGLAHRYQIELISLYRRRNDLAYDLDPRVAVTNLHDARPIGPKGNRYGGRVRIRDYPEQNVYEAELDAQPSQLVSPNADPHVSLLTDTLLVAKLRTLEPGILVSTRPYLHAVAARFAPRHLTTIAQDHQNVETRMPALLDVIHDSARHLDALVALTDADRRAYARALGGAATLIEAIPSALPWNAGPQPIGLDHRIVAAAGRLVEGKGFDRLIRAFAPVAREHPDWQLHIYGKGRERNRLAALISELQLGAQVELRGHTDRIDRALDGASVFASGSHSEGFPMVLLEAMSKGLPAVYFDIPRGPAELITDGLNGRLIPDGDLAGFTEALRQIIENRELRVRMGAAAHRVARQYDIGAIAARWEALFSRLSATEATSAA